MDVRVGPLSKLNTKELMLLNCGVGEDSWEPLDSKKIKLVNSQGNQYRMFIGRYDIEVEAPILWPPYENWLIEKTLMLGKIEGRRRRGWQRMRRFYGFTDSMDMSFSKPWDLVSDREAWHFAVHGITKSGTQLSNWTELNLYAYIILCQMLSYISNSTPQTTILRIIKIISASTWHI